MARGISGNSGKVLAGTSTIAELTQWEAELAKDTQTYNSQDGGVWQKTVAGNKKLSGTLTGKYDPDEPIDAVLDSDAIVALRLYQNSLKYISCQARLGSLNFSANMDTGEPEEWTCTFESDGAVSFV